MAKMERTLLKSKLHRAVVTDANLEYEGSITIDRELMEMADLVLHEKVEIYNCDNGARFSTYVIEGPDGQRDICLNGAAAHLVSPGHKVIICSYQQVPEALVREYRPKVILLDGQNQPKKVGLEKPSQTSGAYFN